MLSRRGQGGVGAEVAALLTAPPAPTTLSLTLFYVVRTGTGRGGSRGSYTSNRSTCHSTIFNPILCCQDGDGAGVVVAAPLTAPLVTPPPWPALRTPTQRMSPSWRTIGAKWAGKEFISIINLNFILNCKRVFSFFKAISPKLKFLKYKKHLNN